MRKLRGWIMRFKGLINRKEKDHELAEEIESHLQMHIEENLEQGMSPEEARRQALLKLGSVDATKESYRDQRGLPWLEAFFQDFRYAARQLRKNPGFTLVAVFTLALGIGASTIVFGLAKGILFRPLGIAEEERLVWMNWMDQRTGKPSEGFSWVEFNEFRSTTSQLEDLALVAWPGVIWEKDDQVENLGSLLVTPGIFDTLKISPALGRFFIESDTDSSAGDVVLISHEFWQSRFAGSPNVLGQTLRLSGKSWTIIGVLPPGLEFPQGRIAGGSRREFWQPLRPEGGDKIKWENRMFSMLGRLRPDTSLREARAELASVSARWAADHQETNRGLAMEAKLYRDKVLGPAQKSVHVLALAVAVVLIICCVNLANLLLAKGITRQKDIAVRRALGAGRGRILGALLTESILLSSLGGIIGIVMATYAVRLIRLYGPAETPFIREVTVDSVVMGLALGLCLVTAFVFGLLPALWQSNIGAAAVLKSGVRSSAGPQVRGWQHSLLVGQVALVMLLLTCAALLMESFRRLMGVELGYQTQSVININIGSWGLASNADNVRLYREIRNRLTALNGVEAVGTIHFTPLKGGWTWEEKAQVFGRPRPKEEQPSLGVTFVAFDYFRAMDIPVISGRSFRESELLDDRYAPVAVINESAAAQLFPGEPAIGGQFSISSSPDRFYEVIGIVKDTRDMRLDEKPQPRFYLLYIYGGTQLMVRSALPSNVMIPVLRDTLKQFGPRVILHSISPMDEIVSSTVAERCFLMGMLTTYAAIALGIAAAGIFGVAAYQVAQRTNEFGIRLALGASPSNLAKLVLRQMGRLTVVGLVIGLALALFASRLLESQLFGLSPYDPILHFSASLVLLAVGLLASFLPAHRASKVDPMTALRCE